MKDYSNYGFSPNDKILNDANTIFDMQLQGLEGEDVKIDGIDCKALIYNHLNDLNEFKEERVISCKSNINLHRGSCVEFENENYIVISDIDSHKVYLKAKMQKTNDYLNYKNNNNTYRIPAIVTNQTLYTVGLQEGKTITTGDTKMSISVPVKAETECIYRGMRFIFDNNNSKIAYEITYIDAISRKGLLTFTLKECALLPQDDLINNIAYNEDLIIQPTPTGALVLQGSDNILLDKQSIYSVAYDNGSAMNLTFDWLMELDYTLANVTAYNTVSCTVKANNSTIGVVRLVARCRENNAIRVTKDITIKKTLW